jgi:mannitol-1-phosphate/altronate dehydrogenase
LRATAAFKDPQKFFAMRELFSEELAKSERFVKEVNEAFESFYQNGAKATLERWLELE